MVMRHSVRAALDPVDPFANKMGLVDRLSPQAAKVFSDNPPPKVGRWLLVRGIDDPNRVHVVGEVEPSDVGAVKQFITSEKMQAVFKQVNEMSTQPIEFIWMDEVKLG